jgi:hypothetical protein
MKIAFVIACLVLTALTLAASGKPRGLRSSDRLLTTPLCRNGYRLIQQQQDDPRGRCLLVEGQLRKSYRAER